jgi:hypothetical protein
MSSMSDDIDRSIAALQAIKLVKDCHASSPEGVNHTKDILKMLAMGGEEHALRKHIAVAISKALANQPVPT